MHTWKQTITYNNQIFTFTIYMGRYYFLLESIDYMIYMLYIAYKCIYYSYITIKDSLYVVNGNLLSRYSLLQINFKIVQPTCQIHLIDSLWNKKVKNYT